MRRQGRWVRFLLRANLLLSCGRVGFSPEDLAGPVDTGPVDAGAVDAGRTTMLCSAGLTLDAGDDGSCEADDICPGWDDGEDADGDGIPDGCDPCGDGLVDVSIGETCDPATQPNSCPVDCGDGDPCTEDLLRGSALECDAACSSRAITQPSNGDGCCPPGADSVADSDCPPLCGNGLIDDGEACDPGSAATECPVGCDDGDVCTRDVSSGEAQTCDVSCSHDAIVTPFNEDGCCPPGANSIVDVDCAPICGNGTVEVGEECDGEVGCSDCTWTPQGRCLTILGDDACSQCACASCANDMLNCYQTGDSERDLRCPPVVECALAEGCTGTCGAPYYCYGEVCWGAGDPPPNGPCKTPISAAAGNATTTNQVGPRSQDSSYPLYWSEQYGTCLRDQCGAECDI
jgi:hypothetical protein